MRWVRRLIGLAIFAAIMVGGWRFASENETPVTVQYLAGAIELPAWQALIGVFGLGFATAGLGWLLFGVRAGLIRCRYSKAVGGLESEIHQLRNLPLAPDAPTSGDSGVAPSRGMAPGGAGGRSG